MTSRRIANWIAACCLIACGAGSVRGQATDAFCDGCCEHDLQFFAPADFDFDCMPIKDECGFFFNYSRLAWYMTGERVTIGQKGLVVPSEISYLPNNPLAENTVGVPPQGLGDPPAGYDVINGIQDAPPNARVGWGHRYELGYFKGGNGWLVGVLDGPRTTSQEQYGFQEITIPNTLPLVTQGNLHLGNTPLNFTPGLPPLLAGGNPTNTGGGAGSADLSTARYGFPSVHVNFSVPNADYLKGWRDYAINGANDQLNPNLNGSSRVLTVAQVTATQVAGQGTVAIQITGASVSAQADGVVDNISGSGTGGTFFVFFQDTNGNGTIDDDEPILGTAVNFNNLHTFNIAFDRFYVKNTTSTDGVEIMRTVELDNSHLPVKEQRNHFDIGAGARLLVIKDDFYWNGDGGILGRTYQDTSVANQIVGPQIRARWSHQRQRFGFDLDGRMLFGYNISDVKQRAALGEDLAPAAVNSLVNAQPTFSATGRQDNFFSPVAEMRAEARYQVTGALAAKLGYTGIFVDNISRGSELVRYSLPDFGLREGGKQNIFINGVDFGFDLVY